MKTALVSTFMTFFVSFVVANSLADLIAILGTSLMALYWYGMIKQRILRRGYNGSMKEYLKSIIKKRNK